MFSCVLTRSGDVLVWWPFSEQVDTSLRKEMNKEGNRDASAPRDGAIPCVPWESDLEPLRLPSLPLLPDLANGVSAEQWPTQLIQVAGLDGHLVALTNKGHVLIFSSLDNEIVASRGNWKYLPEFSEVDKVRDIFAEHGMDPPPSAHITHISANFQHFFAYSTGLSSIVLKGDMDNDSLKPKIIPGLQNKSVISVVPGDHHYIALTLAGKVLTWGVCDKGALGLGDPAILPRGVPGAFPIGGGYQMSDVEEPTEVRFDHSRKKLDDKFCFSIAAAGWHTGALVINLEPDEDDCDVAKTTNKGSSALQGPVSYTNNTGQTPPIISPFRVGFAGRGMRRGGAMG